METYDILEIIRDIEKDKTFNNIEEMFLYSDTIKEIIKFSKENCFYNYMKMNEFFEIENEVFESNQINFIGNYIENFKILLGSTSSITINNNIQMEELPSFFKLFYNLENLYIVDNKIKRISNLENCVNLKFLNLSGNNLETIEGLNNCINLKNLNLDFNEIKNNDKTGINSNLKNLEILSLNNNQIEELNIFYQNDRLMHLELNNNCIEFLDGIENFPNLKKLHLTNNELKNCLIKIENHKNKVIEEHQLTEILKNLEELNINDNYLTNLTGLNFDNTNLIKLNINDNQIISLKNLENYTSLKELYAENNQIYDFFYLENIENLYLGKNKIEKIDFNEFSNFKNLEQLYLNENPLREIKNLNNCVKLKNLNLYKTRINDFSEISKAINLISLNINLTNIINLIGYKKLIYLKDFKCNKPNEIPIRMIDCKNSINLMMNEYSEEEIQQMYKNYFNFRNKDRLILIEKLKKERIEKRKKQLFKLKESINFKDNNKEFHDNINFGF